MVVEISPNNFYRKSELLELGFSEHFLQMLRCRGLSAPGDWYFGAAILQAAGVLNGIPDSRLPSQPGARGVEVRRDSGDERRRAEVLPLGTHAGDLENERRRVGRQIKDAFSRSGPR